MQITTFGLLTIPLCLLCSLSPEWLLCLTILTGGFEAASSVVIGSFGVPLNVLPALLFIIHLAVLRLMGGRFVGAAATLRSMTPLLLFLALVVAGAVLLPRVFADGVAVWPQKSDERAQVPLGFSAANVTQAAYMVLNIGLMSAAAVYVASYRIATRRFLATYLVCGLVVVLVGVWQLASRVAGVPFPADLFYSNPGWVIFSDQVLGSIPRTNGPFSEPASLAGFLCGTSFAAAWLMLHGRSDPLVRWALAASILGILLSTSTTGFAILGLGAAFLAAYALAGAKPAVARRFGRVAVPLALLAALAAVTLPVLAPGVVGSASEVIQGTLSKTDSQSYDERSQADLDSVALLVPTYGLGAGWGSNRSSSLVPGILGNAGLPGLGLVIWAILALRRDIRVLRVRITDPDDRWTLQGLSAGMLGFFVASVVSGPTITALTFYALVGVMLGILGRTRLRTDAAAGAARRMPARALG